MLLVKVPKITNRLQYTFGYLFSFLYGVKVQFTLSDDEYLSASCPRFEYAHEPCCKEGLFFGSSDLLFRRSIEGLDMDQVRSEYDLFPVYHLSSVLPYDPFASSFYMLSRYEEYLPFRKDLHGRFGASESLAFRKGFLQKAVVNVWASEVIEILKNYYPGLSLKQTNYKYIPTVDVDLAYSYLHKGLVRTLGGYAKSLIQGDYTMFRQRTRVLMGREKDPFDSFDSLNSLHAEYGLEAVFFFLFAGYGPYDKSLPVYNSGFRRLIQRQADVARVGIHPSYASHSDVQALRAEITGLSQTLNMEITLSRQHFLRLTFPHTYRNLINLDIREDYTMGYADQPGFRAGVCNPFPFFDLDLDTSTGLMVYPFMIMDGTFKDYLRLSNEEAMEQMIGIAREVKKHRGTLISLWHNETHGGSGRWAGWPGLYARFVQFATT